MMKLRLQVPPDRERTAAATLSDRGQVVVTDDAAASASVLIAKKLGNAECDPMRIGGHPPLGTYRFLQTQPVDPGQRDEYGAHALAFEPVSGPALGAESFGRLGLLVYGGRPGKDGRVRRTQGGVRLTDTLLERLVAALGQQNELTLELAPIKAAAWWAFWRKPVQTQPLSAEPPTHSTAPFDELTLLNTLLASAPRRPRKSSDDVDTWDDDRRWRERDSSSSSSAESFKGGGGDFSGAGASGRWDAPSSAVDQTGRIIAAVAAGAALAGIAGAASDTAPGENALTDTSTGTSY